MVENREREEERGGGGGDREEKRGEGYLAWFDDHKHVEETFGKEGSGQAC